MFFILRCSQDDNDDIEPELAAIPESPKSPQSEEMVRMWSNTAYYSIDYNLSSVSYPFLFHVGVGYFPRPISCGKARAGESEYRRSE
jgi:hypothetical protein